MARITREAGLEFSGIGGYVRASDRANGPRILAATAELGARRVLPLEQRTRDNLAYLRAIHERVSQAGPA